jgi:hypothetical protein
MQFRRWRLIRMLDAKSAAGFGWVAVFGLVMPTFPSAFDANDCPGQPSQWRCCGSRSSSVTRKPAAATTATITSAIGTLILNAPPPVQIVGEQAAHQWACHRRDPKHRVQDALVVAAAPQRNDLTDQRTAGDAHRADRWWMLVCVAVPGR